MCLWRRSRCRVSEMLSGSSPQMDAAVKQLTYQTQVTTAVGP